ncbi:uncharacterized protein Z519_03571 [Cladophialophora bantiana CBS 173.52]|uniref:Uncharacterized protein n=1 Tax=Cladophialophora bantiana (strain ATCC 10958 / CBS 173.52 / CDC B-1940 / NIH 8579) TaxID=1442370 RepID=A0A0D2GDU9_CLAB1|nr:uncharacterized protein Z519_03571 [Cladophialophora bantiana CBS 173.52]KIW96502.1 hypothetical protein Z519_03571 [Cladophialophora bantiana CBS 173.52]
MDYEYYHHDYYYDGYNDYDGWDGEYGGEDYDYNESYWEDDYWYHEESPEYYHQHYDESQDYGNGYHHYHASEEDYGDHSGEYYDHGYNQGSSRGGNYHYTEGATYNQHDQHQHHYYGSDSWSASTVHHSSDHVHSSSHAVDNHTPKTVILELPVSPPPPASPAPPNISALSMLRTGTPLFSTSFPNPSRALSINRDQSLSVKPIDSQSTQSARSPTPTESFFHNLFWRSPVKARARTRPSSPIVRSNSRQMLHRPHSPANNLNRSPSAARNSPMTGYDATRGRDIGFLAPSPVQG